MIRVILADDQAIVRAGLRTILELEVDISVVGEAENGSQAVELTSTIPCDVILMDVRMPELNGVRATGAITSRPNHPHVVILTTFQDEDYLIEALRAGASGFLLKDAGADLLIAGVRAAAVGDSLIDPAMTKSLIERSLTRSRGDASHAEKSPHATLIAQLSARERDMLGALARGLSNAEIAREFFLGEATVKTHIGGLLAKTGARSRAQAAVFAYESGFVRPAWLQDT